MMNFINHRKIVGEKEIFYNEAELNSEAQSRLLRRKTVRGRKKKQCEFGCECEDIFLLHTQKKQREFEFECEEKAKVKRSYSNPQKKE
jgi:hypothetical protein